MAGLGSEQTGLGSIPTAGNVGGGSDQTFVEEVVAGAGISVDDTDPAAPVVSNTGILAITAGTGIGVTAGQSPTVSNTGVLSVSAGTNVTLGGTASAPQVNATDQTANFAAITYKGVAGAPQNIGPLATGILQTTNAANVSTVSSAVVPAGIVPVGAAAGTGLLRVDAKAFYYEASSARPRLNINSTSAWADETNVSAGIQISSTAASGQEAVLQLVGNDVGMIRAYQSSDGLIIGNQRFIDGADGATSGAVQFNTRLATGLGGSVVECGRFEGGGIIAPNGPVTIGNTGISGTESGKSYLLMQEHGTPGLSNSGQCFFRYRTSGGGGNDWPQVSVNGGSYADLARNGQGANVTTAATTTLGSDGTYFHLIGGTTIDFLTITRIPPGHPQWIYFGVQTTINNNTGSPPANTKAFQLIGAANNTYAAGAKALFVYDTVQGKIVELVRTDP